jgi:hypothetical protein
MISYRSTVSAFSLRGQRGDRHAFLVYSALITAAMLAIAAFISATIRNTLHEHISTLGLADEFAMWVLGCALFIVAPATVAANVGEERRSGTLDLLRTAPLSPTMLTLGFLSGAPGGLFVLLLGPLALHCIAGVLGVYPLVALPQSLFILSTGSFALMLVAMLAALTVGREGGGAMPLLVGASMALGAIITTGISCDASGITWAFVHPAGALAALYAQYPGVHQQMFVSEWQATHLLDRSGAWLPIESIFAGCVYAASSAVLLIAARRALSGEPPARFTKSEAIALFSICVLGLLIPLRSYLEPDGLRRDSIYAFAYALCIPYVLCVLGATPSAHGYDPKASRLSDRGSPFFAAVLMQLLTIAFGVLLFGTNVLRLVFDDVQLTTPAFYLVVLSFPIFALFASTRIATPSARVGFWVFITVHMVLQLPSWLMCNRSSEYMEPRVETVLAQCGAAIGVLLPMFIAWRQIVGERRATLRA